VRQAFVLASATLVFLAAFSLLVALYLWLYRSPGFLLITDASITDYNRFLESRSRGREIAYHVLAVAIASGCGKLTMYWLPCFASVTRREWGQLLKWGKEE
jgi:hypothetical protein